MNSKSWQLYIKKRHFPQWLSISIFLIPFFLSVLMDFLHFPGVVKYAIDLAWITSLLFLFAGKCISIKKSIVPYAVFIAIWLLYVITVYAFRFQSVFYFLWGIRNNFRFYVAFIAFAVFLDKDEVSGLLELVDWLFWINAVVSLVQFFVLGYRQDYLGGIFGVERGCNAYSMVLFAMVITRSLFLYFDGQEKTGVCLLKCGLSVIVAAMAELKFFFILFILMVILAMLMTKFSWRKFIVFLSIAVLTMFAGRILTIIFGAQETLSIQRILDLAKADNYATTEDLGRFTAIPTISQRIFKDWTDRLFGLGIGNCDTSAFAICNTPFYQTYEHLHYSWFSSAFLFLETGYIGLILNLLFYVVVMFGAIRRMKRNPDNALYCRMAVVFASICIILTFYNSALRKEAGYLAYFVLAIPFVTDQGYQLSE